MTDKELEKMWKAIDKCAEWKPGDGEFTIDASLKYEIYEEE